VLLSACNGAEDAWQGDSLGTGQQYRFLGGIAVQTCFSQVPSTGLHLVLLTYLALQEWAG